MSSLDVLNSDREVQLVRLGFEWLEESVDVLGFVGLQVTVGVLNVKHSEVEVPVVQLLELGEVDRVLQLGDSEVLDLDRVRDGEFHADRDGRHLVSVLEQLEACPA